ncbi:MAG: GerMN domain-containing protein [Candidatus Melainabacteria bacterium]
MKPLARLLPLMLIALMAVLPLAGCTRWFSGKAKPQAEEVIVHFSKSRGSEVVTEGIRRAIPKGQAQGELQDAMLQLLKGPTEEEKAQGYFSEIPAGTHLLGITENGKAVRINLSPEFMSGGGATSVTQRMAELKATALAADQQHEIYIDIDGKPLEDLGTGSGLEVENPLRQNVQ